MLRRLYPDEVKNTNYGRTLSSLAFVGIIVGMLSFGYLRCATFRTRYFSRRLTILRSSQRPLWPQVWHGVCPGRAREAHDPQTRDVDACTVVCR